MEQIDGCQRGEARTGWKIVKGLTKEYLCMTHGHGQRYGDQLGKGRGGDWVEAGKGRKGRDICNSINNK